MAHNRLFIINNDNFESIKRSARIRNPQEQLDNLVIGLGGVEDPSEFKIENREGILAIVGAPINSASYEYLIVNARERNLIDCRRSLDGSIEMPVELRLTLAGWERFATLQTIQSDSKNAFMAMKFDEPTVTQAFEQCFKPAVADAGFTLSIATDIQKAGHIDDQMMVAIRTARFIIADSSDDNRGVYWEAGFAHGLGKPVFYTCQEDIFNDPDRKPHFDIDHMVTIKWNLENLETARKELTARIRNTFPTEARLSDTG